MSPLEGRVRPTRQRLMALATVVASLFVMLQLLASPALADSYTLDIPLMVVHGVAGSELVIYEGPMPVYGAECEVVVSRASNNNSVHPGNDLRLESNGEVIYFDDVERAADVETPGSSSIVPGPVGKLILTFGPDHVFSAGAQLVFECIPTPTSTSTTVIGSSTTIPEAPTTTGAGDTTTVPEAPTTTGPGTSTTTYGATTTTDEVGPSVVETTSTIAGTATSPPDEVLDTEVLPFTGADSGRLTMLAVTLMAIGSILVVALRERRQD